MIQLKCLKLNHLTAENKEETQKQKQNMKATKKNGIWDSYKTINTKTKTKYKSK